MRRLTHPSSSRTPTGRCLSRWVLSGAVHAVGTDVEEVDETGHLERAVHGTAGRAEDEVAPYVTSLLLGSDEQPQTGGVDELELVQIEDDNGAGGGRDQLGQRLANVARRRGIELAGECDDPLAVVARAHGNVEMWCGQEAPLAGRSGFGCRLSRPVSTRPHASGNAPSAAHREGSATLGGNRRLRDQEP